MSSLMASLALLLVFILAFSGRSDATWCVCRSDIPDTSLQKTLDYACGSGADCLPSHQKGACFAPDTVRSHCSYAVNSYFQKNGQNAQACDFSGTATITTTDPSYGSCPYPATASAAGTSTGTTTTTNTPASPFSATTTPNTFTPNTFTPTNGGVLGLGPSSANSFSTDGTGDATRHSIKGLNGIFFLVFITMVSSGLLLQMG